MTSAGGEARKRAEELANRVCLDPRYTHEMPDDQAEVLTDLIQAYDALADRVEAAQNETRRLEEVYGERGKREAQLKEALDRAGERVGALEEALRLLLAAAEDECAPKEYSRDKDAKYWAKQELGASVPGVDRRIMLARGVLKARAALAGSPEAGSPTREQE